MRVVVEAACHEFPSDQGCEDGILGHSRLRVQRAAPAECVGAILEDAADVVSPGGDGVEREVFGRGADGTAAGLVAPADGREIGGKQAAREEGPRGDGHQGCGDEGARHVVTPAVHRRPARSVARRLPQSAQVVVARTQRRVMPITHRRHSRFHVYIVAPAIWLSHPHRQPTHKPIATCATISQLTPSPQSLLHDLPNFPKLSQTLPNPSKTTQLISRLILRFPPHLHAAGTSSHGCDCFCFRKKQCASISPVRPTRGKRGGAPYTDATSLPKQVTTLAFSGRKLHNVWPFSPYDAAMEFMEPNASTVRSELSQHANMSSCSCRRLHGHAPAAAMAHVPPHSGAAPSLASPPSSTTASITSTPP